MATADVDKAARIRAKVERIGAFFERYGFAPVTGRVFAYLLVSTPSQSDFFSIQAFLRASKSTVSTALTTLRGEGLVDDVTLGGRRRRYFRINTSGWMNSLKNRLRRTTTLNEVLEDVLEEHNNAPEPLYFNRDLNRTSAVQARWPDGDERPVDEWDEKTINRDLNKIAVFQNYLADGIERLLDEWDEKQS
ncbi:MAG: hypothetical protein ABMA02_06705 [Saprospiraceae bacterium]